jgi:hypothetical protein
MKHFDITLLFIIQIAVPVAQTWIGLPNIDHSKHSFGSRYHDLGGLQKLTKYERP